MPENNIEKSFGFILKEARANKHISLEEASKHTRIHINILKAIENDDVASLGAVYVKSFLRLYADYLGVDKEDVLRRFRQATGQPEAGDLRRAISPERYPTRKLRADILFLKNCKIFIVVVLVFIAIALIVKFVKRHAARPRAAQVTTQVAAQGAAKKAEVKRPAPVSVPVTQPVDKPAVVKKEPISNPPDEKIQKKIVLVIRAKDKCWLQVKVDGKVIFQNVLAKGSSESWQAYEKIELWLGNAGAVQFELNGRPLQKIGRPGQTLRHVVVTRAGLSIRG
ncbi:MAG: RodZ domain-containing protein [Candidatus Omnitrophota bacterium]